MGKQMLASLSMFIMVGRSSAAQRQLQRFIDGTEHTHGPDLIVMAALHGTGSTMLSSALNKHPCMVSMGEPFSASEHLYAPDDEAHKHARTLFRNHSKPDRKGTYHKLESKLKAAVGTKVHIGTGLQMKSSNFHDFFKSVRKAACDAYDLPKICDGSCVLVHKLFPDYLFDNFDVARSYLMSSDVGIIHLHRNEKALVQSNSRRFHGYSDGKEKRDKEWNDYLFELKRHAPGSKVWRDVKAETLFHGASAYMNELTGLFRDLKLDSRNMTEPVQNFIDREFNHYGGNHHHR